eukprot:CFRG5350T1
MASIGDDCRYFVYTKCPKGENCPQRHCIPAKDSEIVCVPWQKGICYEPLCPHMHHIPEYDGTFCYYETTKEGCNKRECRYRHKLTRPQHTRRRETANASSQQQSQAYTHSSSAHTNIRPPSHMDNPPLMRNQYWQETPEPARHGPMRKRLSVHERLGPAPGADRREDRRIERNPVLRNGILAQPLRHNPIAPPEGRRLSGLVEERRRSVYVNPKVHPQLRTYQLPAREPQQYQPVDRQRSFRGRAHSARESYEDDLMSYQKGQSHVDPGLMGVAPTHALGHEYPPRPQHGLWKEPSNTRPLRPPFPKPKPNSNGPAFKRPHNATRPLRPPPSQRPHHIDPFPPFNRPPLSRPSYPNQQASRPLVNSNRPPRATVGIAAPRVSLLPIPVPPGLPNQQISHNGPPRAPNLHLPFSIRGPRAPVPRAPGQPYLIPPHSQMNGRITVKNKTKKKKLNNTTATVKSTTHTTAAVKPMAVPPKNEKKDSEQVEMLVDTEAVTKDGSHNAEEDYESSDSGSGDDSNRGARSYRNVKRKRTVASMDSNSVEDDEVKKNAEVVSEDGVNNSEETYINASEPQPKRQKVDTVSTVPKGTNPTTETTESPPSVVPIADDTQYDDYDKNEEFEILEYTEEELQLLGDMPIDS